MPATLDFAVIKYVPDPAKKESINIGLVSQFQFTCKIRFIDNWERVRAIDPHVNIALIKGAEEVIRSALEARGKLDKEFVRQFGLTVQLGEPVQVTLEDSQKAEEVLETLYIKLVEPQREPPDLATSSKQLLDSLIRDIQVKELLEKGDIEGAKNAFHEIPRDPQGLTGYITVLARSHEPADWSKGWNLLKSSGIRSARLFTNLAYRHWSIGKADVAISIAEEGLRISEEDKLGPKVILGLKNSLAYYYAESRNPIFEEKARNLSREAYLGRPEEPEPLDTLGFVKIVFGKTPSEILEGVSLCEEARKKGIEFGFYRKHINVAFDRLRELGALSSHDLGV